MEETLFSPSSILGSLLNTVDHISLNLFLGSQFYFIGLFVYFYASIIHFDDYSLIVSVTLFALFLFLRISLVIRVFCGSIHILGVFFYLCKKSHWNFNRNCIESVDGFYLYLL